MTLNIIISIILVGIISYYLLFPKDTLLMITLNNGSGVTFSKTGINREKKPDYYPQNGFE
jgi:hypothetical protein